MKMTDEIEDMFIECIGEQGMNIEFAENSFTLYGSSDAGEDLTENFYYDGSVENFIEQIDSLYQNYDIDEHVDMWADMRGKNGVPDSYRVLVEDAEMIGELYDNLSMACARVYNMIQKENNI